MPAKSQILSTIARLHLVVLDFKAENVIQEFYLPSCMFKDQTHDKIVLAKVGGLVDWLVKASSVWCAVDGGGGYPNYIHCLDGEKEGNISRKDLP